MSNFSVDTNDVHFVLDQHT